MRVSKAKIRYTGVGGIEVPITDKVEQIRFDFANGETIVVDMPSVPKSMKAIATVRGLAEKIRDTYAGSETVEAAYIDAEDMVSRLLDGEWMSAREGGGPRMTMLLTAIQEVKTARGTPFDLEEHRARYLNAETDTDAERETKLARRKAAAANSEVAAVLDRLRAEAAARRADKTPIDAASVDDL